MTREKIIINEVGLRDGLQNQRQIVSTREKLMLLDSLLDTGITHAEVTAFVSPRAVPQMADAAELCSRLPQKELMHYSVLVPNREGYERARVAHMKSVAVVLGATETMNQRNIHMSLEEARATCGEIMRRARNDRVQARAYISVAFICPYEGKVAPERVRDLTAQMFDSGADDVIIADTIGHANPKDVGGMFETLIAKHGATHLAGHFHDTQGFAMANCWAAAERGIRNFDASIGGLGGCPFAPGAAGNAATEDLVYLFENAGLDTGIDLAKLGKAVGIVESVTGASLGGHWLKWKRSQTAKRAGTDKH